MTVLAVVSAVLVLVLAVAMIRSERDAARNARLVAEMETVVAERDLLEAAAALLGVESFAHRVLVDLEAAPAPAEPCPAVAALRTIEASCRAARAAITTVDPTRPRGDHVCPPPR